MPILSTAQSSGKPSSAYSLRAADFAWLAVALAAVCLSRLAHVDILWVEEAYGLAAARQLLSGAALYTDIWFDKPPIYAWYYLLCEGSAGWPVRLLGAATVVVCAAAAGLVAARLWSHREAALAFFLTCWSFTFWLPSAVMAVAPDLLMWTPQMLAVLAASSGAAPLAGALAGVAVLANSKGLLVLPLVLIWIPKRVVSVIVGFAAVQAAALAFVDARAYWQEVWAWGIVYAADSFVARPWQEFGVRTAGWMWFHLALVAASGYYFRRRDEERFRMAVWWGLGLLAVVGGLRFVPRYYFALLAPAVLTAARGLHTMPRGWRTVVLLLLLIPALRFGPRYVEVALTGAPEWNDLALMRDAQEAAGRVRARSVPGDDLLVWGYRPEIFVFSGLPAGTRFLDSQPLTGVLADRHLTDSRASFPDLAASNRQQLAQARRPTFVVDGLGPVNPNLAIGNYPVLSNWLAEYELIGHTRMSAIYRLRARP